MIIFGDEVNYYNNKKLDMKELLLATLLEDYINDNDRFAKISNLLFNNNIITDMSTISDSTKLLRQSILQKLSGLKDRSNINNNFTKIEDLGAGAYGVVSRVINKCDNNEYAIKKVPIKKGTLYEKRLKEVVLMSKLNHPNIVRYHNSWIDSIKEDDTNNNNNILIKPVPILNIQMELCDRTLKEYIQQRKTINLDENKKIMEGIINGLDYIHKNGIVHRDINPNNILLDSELNVKITDFGIAISDGETITENPSYIYGNPIYVAPEVNNGIITKKCDIYSAGVLFFELINMFKTNMERIISISNISNTDSDLVSVMISPYENRIDDISKCLQYL